MVRQLIISLRLTLVTIALLGIAYPLGMVLVARLAFHAQANDWLIQRGGEVVGSANVGQTFARAGYFHGRPSAAGNGYDPTQTGGTNLGPTSKKLIDATRKTIAQLRRENPDATVPIPIDLVTSSASGIDPDISPQAAQYQVPRVARARGLAIAAVETLVAAHTRGRDLGIFGEPRVNVLQLNLALDALTPARVR